MQKKINFFLATTKPQIFAERILNYFKIHNYFTQIKGLPLGLTTTTKSDLINQILCENITVKAENTIFVGDTKFYFIAATTHQISAIFVFYGFGIKEELEMLLPYKIATTVQKLTDIILTQNNDV